MSERQVTNPLKSLVDFMSGTGFSEHFQGRIAGEIPFYKVSDMSSPGNEIYLKKANNYVAGELARSQGWKIIPAGAVVFAKVGAALLLNRRRILSVDSLIDNNMMAVVPKPGISTGWIYWQLLGVDFAGFVQDGALPSVNQRQLYEIPIPSLGAADEEQVVEILDTLDTAIRETEALIDKLKAVKQGLLHDLLTRGIDASGQLRPPQSEAPQLYKESPLGWIPREWGQTSTRDLCSLITKGTTPAAANMWQCGEGIRFLRVDNLSFDGRFDFEASDFRVSLRTHQGELSRSICLPGDVLTNIVGPPLGKLGLVTAQIGEVNINQAIALFRPRLTLLSGFLLLWLGSLPAQTWLRKRAKQTSGQVNLTLALCQELPIPEISLEEQQLIVDRIAKVHERLSMEAGELGKLYSTKSGLMDDLLTGRVRVTPLLESVPQPAAPTGA